MMSRTLMWAKSFITARSQGEAAGDFRCPTVVHADANQFADFEACAKFYRGNTNYPQASPGSTPAQVVRVALAGFDADYEELRTAAAARPLCRFPIDYATDQGAENPFAILLPHLAKLKGISYTLGLRATASLELGQPAAAFADWELAFRLSESIREEPLLIDHLVRIAMLAHSLQVVREALVRQAWTDGQWAALQQRLSTVDLLSEYRQAMRGERACVVQTFDWARRQGWKFDPTFLFSFQENSSLPDSVHLLRLMPGGWYYRNMVTIAKLHQDYSLAVVNPEARRLAPEISRAGEVAIQALPTSPYTILAKQLFSADIANATVKSARMQTHVDAARVACGLERHRLANGQLPDSLDALAPRFLERAPADLIDGQPLRYHRQPEGGYVLYSIGWNQKDDGGQTAWKSSKKGASVNALEGEWVWSLPR